MNDHGPNWFDKYLCRLRVDDAAAVLLALMRAGVRL